MFRFLMFLRFKATGITLWPRRATRPTAGASATTFSAAAEHRQILADDMQLASFLTSFLVVPLIELQASLDQDLFSFGEVFAGDFRRAAPQRHIHERDF